MENRFGLYWSDPSSDVPLLGQLTPNEQETATSPLQQNSQTQASEEITSSPVQQISDSVLSTSSYSKTPVDRVSIIDTNTNNVTPETTKYKIKPGSMSDSYRKRRKREIERQAKIRREAKLPKRTVSVGEKHQKNGLPTRENLESDQTTMTQAFPTRSELKNFKEETKQIARIQSKPHPFDPKDEVPDSALMDFYRSDERFEFERFLERQNKSLNEQPRPKKKKKREILSAETIRCEGCGYHTRQCHNVRYGKYCIDSVRALCHTNVELGIETDRLVFQKTFIDHYHYAWHFDSFCSEKSVVKSPKVLKFTTLPRCLKEHSFDSVVGWAEWFKAGKWVDKREDLPAEWKSY